MIHLALFTTLLTSTVMAQTHDHSTTHDPGAADGHLHDTTRYPSLDHTRNPGSGNSINTAIGSGHGWPLRNGPSGAS